MVAPLSRLRQMASKIDMGQIKEIPIRGRDEVAMLARSLKSYFLRKEEVDHKKSSKIFEMRNVLRSVINRVSEPIFIVDQTTKINYTNERAATLLGLPPHQTEGKILSDCMYSPAIKKACDQAFTGHATDALIDVSIEVADGRSHAMQAKIGVVRNRDGEISRAVIVLFDLEA
jgi:PAS domain S-box-containing protein